MSSISHRKRLRILSLILTEMTAEYRLETSSQRPSGCINAGLVTSRGDHSRVLWPVICSTQHGDLPGWAKGAKPNGPGWAKKAKSALAGRTKTESVKTACYGYNGIVNSTSDFRWITASSRWYLSRNDGSEPPPYSLKVGQLREDGQEAIDVWIGVAVTGWGLIPGYARQNICWYAIETEASCTSIFFWIVVADEEVRSKTFSNYPCAHPQFRIIPRVQMEPPPKTILAGYQTNGHGDLWLSVAITDKGNIPAKACGRHSSYQQGGCWYDKYMIQNFCWLITDRKFLLRRNSDSDSEVPKGAVKSGYLHDGYLPLYSAVAIMENGLVPGYVKDGNLKECLYSFGDVERAAKEFLWVII